jgi:hypothetical protein
MIGGYGRAGSGAWANLKVNSLPAHKKIRVTFKWH